MAQRQKIILRFLDGKLLKGYIQELTIKDDFVFIEDEASHAQKVKLKELKAIFFVRDFQGNKRHRERKSFTGTKSSDRRVFLRFKDGESLTGRIEGETPWEKGFFLESNKGHGFYLIPTDRESNNIKIFVVASAVKDVAMIG